MDRSRASTRASTTSAGFEVLALEIPHKGGRTFGYRVSDGRTAVAYLSDHGPGRPRPGTRRLGAVPRRRAGAGRRRRRADPRRPAHRRGAARPRSRSGHSAADYAVRLAELAGARAVLLFHHDPIRTDDELDAIVESLRRRLVPVTAAAEGAVIDL